MRVSTEIHTVQGHDEAAWRQYKKGAISYGEYLEAGRFAYPADIDLDELMALMSEWGTPRAADL